jgi:hypothetical protein
VALSGSGELTVAGVQFTLSGDTLAWRPDLGFEGEARVVTTIAGVTTSAAVRGEGGGLAASVEGERSGLSLTARLHTGPRPWEDPTISGDLTFEADAALAPQAPTPSGTILMGSAAVSGSWRDPELEGSVRLTGPVAAEGDWSYRGGSGSVQLSGEGVALSLNGDLGGWRGSVAVDAWPLAEQIPWFDDPEVSAHGSVSGGWDGSLIATLDEVAVDAGASRADGQATVQLGSGSPSYTAVLRVDLDLADVRISPALRGRVRGPIAVSGGGTDLDGAALSGLLSLAEGGAADSTDASLAGTLQLRGDLADPVVAVDLEGLGTASGRLRGQLLPLRGQATLDSDLNFSGVESDLRLALDAGSIEAEGTLAYQDLRLRVGASDGGLALRGEGRLDGVHGWIDPAGLAATVEADLGVLVDGAGGRIALDLTLPGAEGVWLRGGIVGAELAGVALGDLTLRSEAPVEAVTVLGEGISGRVALGNGFGWQVALEGVPLTSEIALSLSATGAGLEGLGSGRVQGALAGAPLDVAIVGSNGSSIVLEVEGEALGGHLALGAVLEDDRWSGAVTVADVLLADQRIDLEGSIGGVTNDPVATLDATIVGAVVAEAALTLSRRSVSTEGRVQLPGLAAPLAFDGLLWPAPALALRLAGSDRLLVSAERLALDAELSFSGRVRADLGAAAVEVVGDGRALAATVSVEPTAGLDGMVAVSERLTGTPLSLLERLRERGLLLTGAERISGSLTVLPFDAAVRAGDLRYRGEGFDLVVDGFAAVAGPTELTGQVMIDGTILPISATERLALPFVLASDGNLWQLSIAGERGRLDLELRRDSLDATLRGALEIGGGSIEADLALADRFAAGRVSVEGVRLNGVPGLAGFALSGHIDALGERLIGRLDLDDLAGRGGVAVELSYPVRDLLVGVPPLASLEAEARIRTFDVRSLPAIAQRVPNLQGEVSGVAQLRDGRIVGRVIAPGLAVFASALPADLEFNGTTRALEVRGSVAGSALSGTLTPDGVSALLRFERFPLQSAAEAVAGRSDISAELTGVARLELPFDDLAAADLRVATELIRLERDGVVTTGNATFNYLSGALTVERVAFEGAGRWEASGVIRSDTLDFRASAEDADFGPLLGIVPALAQLDAGARGSLDLVASGSLERPGIDLRSEALEISLAGSTYRLEGAVAVLTGRQLRLDTGLVGLSPIVGSVEIGGGGTLSLAPLRLEQAAFDLEGSATVPILGEVTELVGTISAGDGAPYLRAEGHVGNPFTLEGSLVPLDLRLVGDDLAIRAPTLLLASSVMNADVRISYTDGLDIGGMLIASEARFQLGIRPPSAGQEGGSRSALERVRFADLRIEAPGRIFFNESFATLEARAALTLGGSAAAPQLSGSATALRGSIRFSGRDFAVERGIATFEPARGAYPQIDMAAVTSFDKARVIPAGSGVRFVEPRGSPRFDVRLGFQGALEARRGGGFDLDFDPDLSSDALIEVAGEAALTSGPRSLTPTELLALVTLGRLDISSILAGDGGLVTAVAQGALDTAVDLLVLAELQQALSAALGVEVVEIRTTALSSLLDGAIDDPFGVSLRLGGYLSEELFASFQIGSFDDENGAFAFTNEVRLTYALGPVELDLAGGVNVAADETLTPIPELSSSIRYGLNALLGVEAGIDLSSTRSQFRVGLTLRW